MSIDINYYSFSPSRADKKWKKFEVVITGLRKKYLDWEKDQAQYKEKWGDLDKVMTKEEKELFKFGSDYLFSGKQYNQEELFLTMELIDLHYGSVINEDFECGRDENVYIRSLIESQRLEVEKWDVPTKEAWIKLFLSIDNDVIIQATKLISEEKDWDIDVSKFGIIDYLRCIKKVVKDLKDTKDSVFATYCFNTAEFNPESTGQLLMKRVQKHINQYKNLLPPVL